MARALVTGATGFIGTHVVRALAARGTEVVALARPSSDRRAIEALGARVVIGDLGDRSSLRAAVADADCVIHLASLLKVPWKPEFRSLNIGGTAALAEACAARETPPALVVVSSLAAGGPSPADAPRTEDVEAAPVSQYGRMKLDSERAAVALAARLPITVVRPPMVLGDGDRWALGLFRSAARGVHVTPTWREHRVSLIHAADLAPLLVAAAERGERVAPGVGRGVYYAAAEDRPTYAELGRWIAEAMGLPPPRVVRVPAAISAIAAAGSHLWARLRDRPTILNLDKWREARAGSWICDAAKARRELGLTCAPTRTRLAETAEAYRAAGWI